MKNFYDYTGVQTPDLGTDWKMCFLPLRYTADVIMLYVFLFNVYESEIRIYLLIKIQTSFVYLLLLFNLVVRY